ncbi:hypothetical protein SAMD00019534_033160 [Acytostelium subglobosum LB1]|uniref:hypothetical protein n=1 Tax=Acytostelium subglobosum LB1 TaxID=1410327 RepID=UPI0006448344|nr:hypothetical protein SAMD00019534_033160 [Acytostelium subglobosum LB1]GAM20141.1 hypothetical protein SAMD00019534_033160 [Acytostelium subglobosum LB1]|eukprot:XP_012759662.1 hypothetical protein SAMD00019534_033160 [Acytostelium subglobosum LB1]
MINDRWLLLDPGTILLFACASFTIYYGTIRSYRFHSDNYETSEQIELPRYAYLLIPVFGSLVMLTLYYFLDHIYKLLVVFTSITATFSVAYTILPFVESYTPPRKMTFGRGEDSIVITMGMVVSLVASLGVIAIWVFYDNVTIVNSKQEGSSIEGVGW